MANDYADGVTLRFFFESSQPGTGYAGKTTSDGCGMVCFIFLKTLQPVRLDGAFSVLIHKPATEPERMIFFLCLRSIGLVLARLERFYPQVKRGEEGPLGGNSGHVLAEKKGLGAGTWPTITIAYAQVADPGWIPPWDGYDKPDVNYYNHCGGDGGTPTAIVAIPLPLLRWVRDYYCYCYSGGTTTATAFVAIPPPCLWWWPYYYRYCSSGDTTTAAVAWVESIATAVVGMPLSLFAEPRI